MKVFSPDAPGLSESAGTDALKTLENVVLKDKTIKIELASPGASRAPVARRDLPFTSPFLFLFLSFPPI